MYHVSMPSRAYTSFLQSRRCNRIRTCEKGVNALSGLYLISTPKAVVKTVIDKMCQCPLGLIPHFYFAKASIHRLQISVSMPSRAYTSFLHQKGRVEKYAINVSVNALSGLYLISTYLEITEPEADGSFTCQCPLGLIPHFYQ